MQKPNIERDRRWQRVQAVSGLLFGLFVAAHLFNTLTAMAGAPVYDSVQRWLQTIYQFPLIEVLLLGVVLPVHITAGVVRARLRRQTGAAPAHSVVRFHRIAGWLLAAIVYWHVMAVRLPAVLFDAPPRFAGISFSILWLPAWFYPYYFVLAMAGFWHLFIGSRLALSRLGYQARLPRQRVAMAAAVFGAVAFAGALLAFGGAWFDVGDPLSSPYAKVYLELVNGNWP